MNEYASLLAFEALDRRYEPKEDFEVRTSRREVISLKKYGPVQS